MTPSCWARCQVLTISTVVNAISTRVTQTKIPLSTAMCPASWSNDALKASSSTVADRSLQAAHHLHRVAVVLRAWRGADELVIGYLLQLAGCLDAGYSGRGAAPRSGPLSSAQSFWIRTRSGLVNFGASASGRSSSATWDMTW
jgi:hypothetical protein